MLAEKDGQPVAGALNLKGPQALYGRNWGCLEEYRFLHFELCYYQAIDYAIAHKLPRVEAGAQGEHKIQRGYLPVETYSSHWIADPRLKAAISDFLDRERAYIAQEKGGAGRDVALSQAKVRPERCPTKARRAPRLSLISSRYGTDRPCAALHQRLAAAAMRRQPADARCHGRPGGNRHALVGEETCGLAAPARSSPRRTGGAAPRSRSVVGRRVMFAMVASRGYWASSQPSLRATSPPLTV